MTNAEIREFKSYVRDTVTVKCQSEKAHGQV